MTGHWWSHWVVDLPVLVGATAWVVLYVRGAGVRAGRGFARPRQTMVFLLGVAVVVLGQVSPVAVYSEVLLWPHMVQHLLITVIAAPLLALGGPVSTVRLGLGPGARRTLARGSRKLRRRVEDLTLPRIVLATLAHIAMLWLWHTPPIYDAAVGNHALHLLEHASFLLSAVWFWSEVWATARRSRRTQALATLSLAAMIVQGGLLGALLTFAGRSLYAVYDGSGGLSALEDQQLAGALMWVPPGFVYASVAIRRFVGWLRVAESDLRRREAKERSGTSGAE